MQKPIYPSVNMRITQGYNEGSHKDSFAIDEAGIDSGIEKIRAPFTGIIKKIYPNDANEVWLESIEKVKYPDGTEDYMTIMFAHANDVSNLFIGKRIEQGEEFYSEGTKGNAKGNHCHIECGQGKFTDTGWHKNNSGYYSINNGKNPVDCLWIDESINIIDNHNYNFKMIEAITPTEPSQPIIPEEKGPENDISEPTIPDSAINNDNENNDCDTTENDQPILIFTCPKSDLYGIYLKENEQLYIK